MISLHVFFFISNCIFLIRFVGLCLRFAEDFETSLDDWKPDMTDSNIMNLCVVSEGTYEVCSRTIAQKQDKSGTIAVYLIKKNISQKHIVYFRTEFLKKN